MRPLEWSVPVASEIMNPTNNETAQPITTRLVEPRDALALMGIYNAEVLESTVTFDLVPRTLEEQTVWINDHSGSYPALVAVDAQDLVIGFGSLSPYRDRPAYTTTVEDSIYVANEHRQKKVGTLLMGELIDLGRDHGFHSVMARIVGGHEASIALHRHYGFTVVGTEREVGRKFNTWLDVVLMQLLI